MTNELDAPTLAWIDEISRFKPKRSPVEIALWLDSLVTQGQKIDPAPLERAERCLGFWLASARA